MIFTRAIGILILILGICLMNDSALADDDAMIDIDNHTAIFTGTWTNSTNRILYYGDDYRYAVCNGNDSDAGAVTAEDTFSSSSVGSIAGITGRYAVYVRWVTHPNRTKHARYRIYSGSTLVGNCTMDQEQRGGEWVFCDEVTLNEADSANVKLGNNCELNQIAVADAVRFVRVSKDKDDIVDEAGISWNRNTTILSIPAGTSTILTDSITCPGNGIILATASGTAQTYITSAPKWCYVRFSLSETGLWDEDLITQLSGYLATIDPLGSSIFLQDSVLCSANQSITYRLYATRPVGADCQARIFDSSLVLQYFATQY